MTRLLTVTLATAIILAPAAGLASAARRQSPVDIRTARVVPARHPAPIRAHFADAVTLDLANTWAEGGPVDAEWATLKANVPAGSSVTLGPVRYNLLQFHFHSPAEHAVNGRRAAMEVHYVFLREGSAPCARRPDALLVIGARIVPGKAHAELGKIFDRPALPANAAAPHQAIPDFAPGKVLGSLAKSWRYEGSLTAPASFAPTCDEPEGSVAHQLETGTLPENVQWVVLRAPISMAPAQIAAFRKLFPHGNTRPLMPLGARRVSRTG